MSFGSKINIALSAIFVGAAPVGLELSRDSRDALSWHFGHADLPQCYDIRGQRVQFHALSRRQIEQHRKALNEQVKGKGMRLAPYQIAYAMDGTPDVYYDGQIFLYLPPLLQHTIWGHECSHKQRGHYSVTDFGARSKMEDEADCDAGHALRNKGKFTDKNFIDAQNYLVHVLYRQNRSPELAYYKMAVVWTCHGFSLRPQ